MIFTLSFPVTLTLTFDLKSIFQLLVSSIMSHQIEVTTAPLLQVNQGNLTDRQTDGQTDRQSSTTNVAS